MVARGERERRDAAGKKNRRACFVDGALGMSRRLVVSITRALFSAQAAPASPKRVSSPRAVDEKKKRRRAAERFALSLPRVESRFAALFFPVHHDEPGTVVPVDHRVRGCGEHPRVERRDERLDGARLSAPPAWPTYPTTVTTPPGRSAATAERTARTVLAVSVTSVLSESAPGRYPRLKHATPTPTPPEASGSERVSFSFFFLVKSDDGASSSSSSTDVIAVVSSSSPTYSPTYSPSLAWLSSTSRTREAFPSSNRSSTRPPPTGARPARRTPARHPDLRRRRRARAQRAPRCPTRCPRWHPPRDRPCAPQRATARAPCRSCGRSGGARPRGCGGGDGEAADAPTLATRRPPRARGRGARAADRGAACAGGR